MSEDNIEVQVNSEVEEFNKFFMSLGNSSLVRPEIAILKTFLAWKYKVVAKKEGETPSTPNDP